MISLQYSPITAADVEEAVTFYRDAIGLTVKNDVSNGGHRWVTMGGDGNASIVLSDPFEDADTQLALIAKGAMQPIVFETDDLDAAFERAVAAGAEVVQEPKAQFWGPKDCAFRDPSGHMIRISQIAG